MKKLVLLIVLSLLSLGGYSQVQSSEHSFSVAPNRSVIFSLGNLQYHAKKNMYRFANNQYDIIGKAQPQNSMGWCDLFDWKESNEYVLNDADAKNWRVLTKNEWEYLLFERDNASALLGVAKVGGVWGVIVLPDTYSEQGNGFKSFFDLKLKPGQMWYILEDMIDKYNVYNNQQWASLEQLGAIFLPVTEKLSAQKGKDESKECYYWSLDYVPTCVGRYYGLAISSLSVNISEYLREDMHCFVRLVKDVKNINY